MILIGFSAISNVKADVCDSEWWKTATVPDLEALVANEEYDFPESCTWDTPLHLAVQHSQDALVVAAYINRTGADVNINTPNAYEQTPLELAERRLGTARLLADYAKSTHLNALEGFFAVSNEASSRHLLPDLREAIAEAKENRDQAESEQKVAEDIYQALSSR